MNDFPIAEIGSLASAWAARGWLALLAFTAAVLVVAALRKPCRRWFGSERAFQWWLLPPLVVLASQLPHAVAAPASMPPLVYTITSAVAAPLPQAGSASGFDGRSAVMLLWLLGLAAALGWAVAAQYRYRRRLRGATPWPRASSRWPVLCAADADTGPALVGAWRRRIVLPADFEQRYDATEQALILAHESAHARRGDGCWSLLAHALVALFWLHPLAWWALAALRRDQELACDAAVLREHHGAHRRYAGAMLKTLSTTQPLPVGCAWSPRHPLTERIAMLKQKPISTLRRRASGMALVVSLGMAAGAIYAITMPAATAHGNAATAPDRFTLVLDASYNGGPVTQRQTSCLKPGEYEYVNGFSGGVPPWSGRFAVFHEGKGLIGIRAEVSGGTLDKTEFDMLRMSPGRKFTILIGKRAVFVSGAGKMARTGQGVRLDIVPSVGCSESDSNSEFDSYAS